MTKLGQDAAGRVGPRIFGIGARDAGTFAIIRRGPSAWCHISRWEPDQGELTSAIGSMNHVAFDVPADKIDDYRARLLAAGVPCTEVANHDDSEWGISEEMHDGVYVRSMYFQDPDGILLELTGWTRPLTPADVAHEPASVERAPASA